MQVDFLVVADQLVQPAGTFQPQVAVLPYRWRREVPDLGAGEFMFGGLVGLPSMKIVMAFLSSWSLSWLSAPWLACSGVVIVLSSPRLPQSIHEYTSLYAQ